MFAPSSHIPPCDPLAPRSPLTDSNRRPLPYHEGGHPLRIPETPAHTRNRDVAPGSSGEGSHDSVVRTSFARPGALDAGTLAVLTTTCRSCGVPVAATWPPGVPCGACLAAAMPERLRTAASGPVGGCTICGDPIGIRCCEHGADR